MAPLKRFSPAAAMNRSRALRQLVRNRAAIMSAAFLALILVAAVLAPVIATHDPNAQALARQLQGPSGENWLGTDAFGRDVYSRLVYSARVTLGAIGIALLLATGIGVPLGIAAGSLGGLVDGLLSRIADAIMSMPPIILALAIIGIFGPGLTNAMIAIGVVLAPPQFRLARGAAQSVASETYIEACRAIGCSPWRLIWRHVLPNASSPLLVQASVSAGVIVIAEASLSFLGLGVQSPQSSWGSMLRDAFNNIYDSPWFMLAPAIMIAATILALSTFGDAVRDALEGRGVKLSRGQSTK